MAWNQTSARVCLACVLLAAGCTDNVGHHAFGPRTDGTSDGAPDETSGGDPNEFTCNIAAGDHGDCEGPGCEILTDVEIRCNDLEVGQEGAYVASTGSEAVIASWGQSQALGVRASGANGERFVLPSYPRDLRLAQPSDGVVHLFVVDGEGLSMFSPNDWGWDQSSVAWQIYNIEDAGFASDGVPHIFSGVPNVHFFEASPGVWQQEETPVHTVLESRYALTPDGQTIVYTAEINGSDSQVWRHDGQQWQPFGSPTDTPIELSPSEAPTPTGQFEGPSDALLALDGLWGLRVIWPSGDGWEEQVVTDARPATLHCHEFGQISGGCPAASCYEQDSGIFERSFDVARTADGTLWIAWIETHFDVGGPYVEGDTRNPTCDWVFGEDHSSATFHLARFNFVEPIEEVARMPISLSFASRQGLDARAFGARLAVGMVLGNGSVWYTKSPKLRLLEFDLGFAEG